MIIKRAFSASSSVSNFYDVIITGGGMIGSVLACKLAMNPFLQDLSLLLIESGPKKAWENELTKSKESYSNRVSSLNTTTRNLLEKIDIWDVVKTCSCQNVTQMKIWGCGSNNINTTFSVKDAPHLKNLAYIVENHIIVAAAMKKLQGHNDRVHVLHDSSVSEYCLPKSDNENVKLQLKDGLQLECGLLLGADGVQSKVRQAMGVQYLSWNYNQKAVVATLKINENNDNNTAWQKFIPSGPIALLPVANEISSLVWTTTPDHVKTLLSLSEESFVDALNTAFWKEPVSDVFASNISNALSTFLKTLNIHDRKDEIVPPTVTNVLENSRASFPVGFGHAVSYVVPKVALIGDAAHRVHPLAGQGVNLGFGDIECLDNVLCKYLSFGTKLGDIKCLREYETIRQRCNIPKLIGIDLIQKVAGHPWSPLLTATNTGFQITNALPPLKKFFINAAAV